MTLKLKVRQMSYFEMVSKWFLFSVHPYQPTLDFAFFILEWTIVKRIRCYIKKKSFQMPQGGH